MVHALSPLSAAFNITRRWLYERQHPEIAKQVDARLYDKVIELYACCAGMADDRCGGLRTAIKRERARPRRTACGGIADNSCDNARHYKGELDRRVVERNCYLYRAACAYIAGGNAATSRPILRKMGFGFSDRGAIIPAPEWQLKPLPKTSKRAMKLVPYSAKQRARAHLWDELLNSHKADEIVRPTGAHPAGL